MLNNLGLGLTITAKDLSKAAFEQVQSSLGLTGVKVEELEKETSKAAATFERAGLAMGAAGGAILAGIGLAISKAHDLEQAFKLVSTRADEATLPMAKVRELALSLSNAFGIDQAEIARASYDAIAKGATDVAAQQSVLTAATQLAVGQQISLTAAMDATTQVIRAFHLPMTSAALVTDQLVTASERGAGSIEELSGALEHLAPGAARANLSSGDLLGAITALSNAGLKGRAAIGGMRAVLDALVQPSDAAKQQAAALGISLDTTKIAAEGFVPWIQKLTSNTGLTAGAMSKLFGSAEATTAVMALMRNQGEDLAETIGQMGQASGAAADAADTMTDQWARAKTLTTNALAALGQAFLPLANLVLKPINAAIEAFTKLSPGMQKAIGFAIAFVGVTLLVAGGLAGATAAVAAFGATIAPVMAAATALILPVALILAGLAAAAYLVKLAWDHDFGGLRTTLTGFYDKAKLIWDGLTQLFTQGGFSGGVLAELNKAGNGGLKNFVITLFLWANRIKAAWDGISGGISAAFSAAGPYLESLSEIVGELGTEFSKLFNDVFGGSNGTKANAEAFHAFAEAGAAVGASLGGLVKAILFVLQVGLIPLRLVVAALTGGWDGFARAALNSFADVIKGVLGMASSVASVIDHLFAAAFGKQLGASAAIDKFAKTYDQGVRPGISPTVTAEAPVTTTGVTTVGRDSASVQEAYAANARLRGGETGAGAASDRSYIEKMIPILEKIQANGNQPTVIHLDGEVIATAVKANQAAHGARGFSPAPAPG